jgi:hypothetical protein
VRSRSDLLDGCCFDDKRDAEFDDGPFVRYRSNGQRRGVPVLTSEAPLDVAETDARRPSPFECLRCRTRARILNGQRQSSLARDTSRQLFLRTTGLRVLTGRASGKGHAASSGGNRLSSRLIKNEYRLEPEGA